MRFLLGLHSPSPASFSEPRPLAGHLGDTQVPSWNQAPQQDKDREHPTGRSGEQRSGDGQSMKAGSPNPFYS